MEVTNEMDCSRTESNEGLTHLSISGERERTTDTERERRNRRDVSDRRRNREKEEKT